VGSDVPFYNSYISKKSIQVPQKDSILSLTTGGVFGPYVDGKNYTIAKVVGVTQWPDSASVRHILIATTNPQNGQAIRADSAAKILADSSLAWQLVGAQALRRFVKNILMTKQVRR
jgi:peptidyl-prolyl cis-trans isomerase D